MHMARVWQACTNAGSQAGVRSPDSERVVVNGPGFRGMGGIHDHTGAMQGLTSDVTDVSILPSPQRPLLCIVEQKHALPAHAVARPPSGV